MRINTIVAWSEMYNYLIKQENCIVQDKEFKVLDLHKTLYGFNEKIMLHKQENRAANMNCQNLKLLLSRIYKLHKQNKFKLLIKK